MRFKTLDTVVLNKDVPEFGLKQGDLGAVVQVYEPDGLEVEFVTAAGRTQALVTLKQADVRQVVDSDLIAVRSLRKTARVPGAPLWQGVSNGPKPTLQSIF